MMKLYGLIGYPLGHSFSKKYFTDKFEKENLEDCFFELFPIPSIGQFPQLIAEHQFDGLCVTIPYKEKVLQYVDECSPEVLEIGATNSLHFKDGKIIAYNTDIIGFKQSFIQFLQPHHKGALILGTGGASKAVKYVLDALDIPFLVVSRTPSIKKNIIGYAAIDATLLAQFPVIINCSPVGMYPNENECPTIPYYLLSSANYLYDVVYKPNPTLFLTKGASMGAVIKSGLDMLIIQAEASWEIWNKKSTLLQ